MRITIPLPAPLAHRLRVMADERGVPVDQQIAEQIQIGVDAWESDERPYRLRAGLPLEG